MAPYIDRNHYKELLAIYGERSTPASNIAVRKSVTMKAKPKSGSPRFSIGDTVTWGGSNEPFMVLGILPDAKRKGVYTYQLYSPTRFGSIHHTDILNTSNELQLVTLLPSYLDNILSAPQLSTSSITVPGAGLPMKKVRKPPMVPKKPAIDFDSVIIADEKRQQILEALEQINQQHLIFTKWGFEETIEKGRGVSLLFWGQPGTGKTLMAQAIASKLKSKLAVISTADIESSVPGESERNIRKHFKEAKTNKTILLFDECDSLIYNRANVGAIMGAQINELLTQIEKFEGIIIFTTNRLGTLDDAMNRRIALKLKFELPTHLERIEIWKRMFPKKAPIDKDVDWNRLATIEVTGGYIKNAVLRAVRMAAAQHLDDNKKTIRMEHLIKALALEAGSMVEFQDAKAMERGRYGQVDMDGIIQRGTGTAIVREEQADES